MRLSVDEQSIVEIVRELVDKDVKPVAHELDHSDTHPEALINTMKELGVFGLAIPEPYGTEEQKQQYLPRMATGQLRATMALTEPGGGSDLQAMRTVANRDEHGYLINGSKTWITNARRSDLVALRCKTDPHAEPKHKGMSILLVEKVPGSVVSKDLSKLGYKGVESCELSFDDCRVPADALLGTVEGKGFGQMMHGLELGRAQPFGG